jgi:hypothetical protein
MDTVTFVTVPVTPDTVICDGYRLACPESGIVMGLVLEKVAAWAPDAMVRIITVEKRTNRARRKIEYPPDFTGYSVRASFEGLFW